MNRPAKKSLIMLLHVPKTAGTSYRRALLALFPADFYGFWYIGTYPQAVQATFRPEDYAEYKIVAGHFDYGICRKYPQLVPITVLRDPIRRTLSLYNYMKGEEQSGYEEHTARLNRPGYGFQDFLLDPLFTDFINNLQTLQIAGYLWGETRGNLSDSELLEIAKTNLSTMPFVGLTERTDESLDLLAHTFNWPRIPELPHENTSAPGIRVNDLTEADLTLLQQVNQLDVELYRHAEQLFEQKLAQMAQDKASPSSASRRQWHIRKDVSAVSKPQKTLFIASTPYSGVFSLGYHLKQLQIFGQVEDYFAVNKQKELKSKWQLPPHIGFLSYLHEVVQRNQSSQSVLGAVLLREHLQELAKDLQNQINSAALTDLLAYFFPNLTWVYFTHGHLARQAALWMTESQLEEKPNTIQSLMYKIASMESAWEVFFIRHHITPLRITYDDFLANPGALVSSIARKMELTLPVTQNLSLPKNHLSKTPEIHSLLEAQILGSEKVI